MTAAEFTNRRDWKRHELVDGKLVGYPCGAAASHVCGHLVTALWNWGGRRAAWIFGSGTTYCFPGRPRTVRRPWVSVIRTERLRREDIPSVEHLTLAPDVVAEVVSHQDTYEEVAVKVADYKSAGVKLIWVISPKTRTALVRRLEGTCAEVGEVGTLSGEDVLPGFACPLAELFV